MRRRLNLKKVKTKKPDKYLKLSKLLQNLFYKMFFFSSATFAGQNKQQVFTAFLRHLGNFKLIYTSGAKVRRQPKTDRLRNTDFDLHKFVSKCHTPGFTYSTGTVVSGSIERKVGSTVNTGIRGEEGDGSLGGASAPPPPHPQQNDIQT